MDTLVLAAPRAVGEDTLESAYAAPVGFRPRLKDRIHGPRRVQQLSRRQKLMLFVAVLMPVTVVANACTLQEGQTWRVTTGWSALYITITPHTYSIFTSDYFGRTACAWNVTCVANQWLAVIVGADAQAFRDLVIIFTYSLMNAMQTISWYPGASVNTGVPGLCLQGWRDYFNQGSGGWETIPVGAGECDW